ncbi:MAG: hypothetical protein MJ124_05420 [Lachnospiraceae bacterium]|nr:hypothetical protein [Lachnospiraceae bacterium]
MGKLLFKLERKYGQYAIRNLSLILIICYCIGFILELLSGILNIDFVGYMCMNPYLILHGQVWRLVSWLIIPPEQFSIFTVIMLYFYYSIGRNLENTWGDFRYNVYIFSGILFTIISAFVLYGGAYFVFRKELAEGIYTAKQLFTQPYDIINPYSGAVVLFPCFWFKGISTYYISMSIFLAYAITFPENRVMLMFFIPIKVKVLGIIYAVIIAFNAFDYVIDKRYYMAVIIVASMLNAFIFFLSTRQYNKISPREIKRRSDFRRKVQWAKANMGHEATHNGKTVITRHKCAICGATELDGDNMEFRFCSKCDGNYEYCNNHLYTHEHVRRI